jgi:hypothetical protein
MEKGLSQKFLPVDFDLRDSYLLEFAFVIYIYFSDTSGSGILLYFELTARCGRWRVLKFSFLLL